MNDTSTHTDEHLLERLRAGSDQAFVEIYNRFWRILRAQAFYFTQDSFLAEDIVQEVFAWVWKNREQMNTSIRLETYLIRATINTCIDDKRKEKTLAARKKLYAYVLDAHYEPRSNMEDDQLGQLLKKAIGEINPATRKAFEKAYIDQQKTSHIAEELGISHQDVRNRISRALKILRTSLSHLRIF
ncbi:sigma-70 family RNA polymerase sigma factor [uncultured Chitinophaga sp.]|uniref:RNA polymerase sigma factor n=1 Tax=uncultured Chitinophaga sp. TaxID=339340 RepID=UPI0025D95AEE|nr:sigma-70 family RNA polymerase sigma factor [uncultured Chitinophaga sp.]